MKTKILVAACLFSLISSSAFCEPPDPAQRDEDETRPYANRLPYHMMLYEQAEEIAQDQYSTIVESPETENAKQEEDLEEEKIKDIKK